MARKYKQSLADEKYDRTNKVNVNEQEDLTDEKIDYAQLIKALQQYDNELLDDIFNKPEDGPPRPISEAGRRNMRDSLAQFIGQNRAELLLEQEQRQYEADVKVWKRKRRTRWVNSAGRWCAVAAMLVVVVIAGNIFSSESMADSVPQVDYVSEKKDDYSKLHAVESDAEFENPCGISTHYILTTSIEGFQLEDKVITSTMNYYTYGNSSNERYQFLQEPIEHEVGINTEKSNYSLIDSSFGVAYYYEYELTNGLVWNYNGYTFRIEGNISQEQLLYLQKSIRKEE